MLNAKSGLGELLQTGANGLAGARGAQEGAQDGGLFGDTLKGHMQRVEKMQAKTTGATDTSAQNASSRQKAEKTDKTDKTDKTTEPAAELEKTGQEPTADEVSAKNDLEKSADEFVLSGEADENLLEYPAVNLLTADEIENKAVAPDDELSEENNESPLFLPQAVADALPQRKAESGEDAPHWLRAMTARQTHGHSATGEVDQKISSTRENDKGGHDFMQAMRALNGAAEAASDMDGKTKPQSLDNVFKLFAQQAPRESSHAQIPAAASAQIAGTATGAGAQANSATPAPALQTLTVDVPVRQAGWEQAMGDRVAWLARQGGLQEAQIQLNPRHLGPIDVHVSVNKDQQATVHFVAQHAMTREVLESAMPRLREMLQESGLNLAQSDVSQHGERMPREEARLSDGGGRGRGQPEHDDDEGPHQVAETALTDGGLSGISYYA